MAEILLSLTIIGIVAAITLPSLTGNINERTWNTQRKALYARFSQAISLMPALNGYGTLKEESSEGASDAVDTATETFLTDGLAKVLKINNICDNEHLEDCGIVTSFTNMAGSQIPIPMTLYELNSHFRSVALHGYSYSTMDTKAAAFETQNGESIIAFYNQSCITDLNPGFSTNQGSFIAFPQSNMCVNFIYDLNGNKGPNTFGKDIGIMTVFNSTDSIVVAPLPASADREGWAPWNMATKFCTDKDSESRMPNIDELSAMLINKNIINLTAGAAFLSNSVGSLDRIWLVSVDGGTRLLVFKDNTQRSIRCVRR